MSTQETTIPINENATPTEDGTKSPEESSISIAEPTPTPPSSSTTTIADTFFSSPLDKQIHHLNRVLSTASGIDTALTLTGFTARLLASQLKHRLDVQLRVFALRFARNASKVLAPGESVIATLPAPAMTARIAAWQDGAQTVAGMCTDVAAFLRLWGLLGMWGWARRTYYNGPKDQTLKVVAWGQVLVNTLYLICEHPAYLAGKGVIKGISPERVRKLGLLSVRMFAAHVALEFVRLWRMREMRLENMHTSDNEKEEKIKNAQAEKTWWREAALNAAYSPMVAHWSVPGGMIDDMWVALLGSIVGVLKFRNAWRATA